mmetsp:Transcript_45508/g.128444  ORF Transcript_45508/g.128444 Transcript_45508/m.128444 type:complete len:119 (-) Transcript_45508:2197-2553(-)
MDSLCVRVVYRFAGTRARANASLPFQLIDANMSIHRPTDQSSILASTQRYQSYQRLSGLSEHVLRALDRQHHTQCRTRTHSLTLLSPICHPAPLHSLIPCSHQPIPHHVHTIQTNVRK